MIKIEILYPNIANLFGETGHFDLLKKIFPHSEIIHTHINEIPKFIDEDIDLVFMGQMSERYQLKIIDAWKPYKDIINQKIESGMHFLFTGNAVEVLYEYIEDDFGNKTEGLGIFPYYSKQQMMDRINSVYLGKYKDLEIVGFKSQFTFAYNIDKELPYLFDNIRGYGMNKDSKGEGIHYKNFMGTYILGPLLILNPDFTLEFMKDFVENPKLEFYKEMKEAYDIRLKEFKNPDTTL